MPQRLTQVDGVLLRGGCHACRMRRASNTRAKFPHCCGRKGRTCTVRQFLHGWCFGALGISNDAMSVPTPMSREERLAKRSALKAWQELDYAQVVGVVAEPAVADSDAEPDEAHSELTKILPPQDSLESFKGWCSWMLTDQDRAKEFETAMLQAADYLKGLDAPGPQQEAVPEDESEPPLTEQGDESDEEIHWAAPAPVERPRSLLTGRFGARDTMDPQLLGSRYRVVG